jgi:exodeoxyribonuclease V beta subunit
LELLDYSVVAQAPSLEEWSQREEVASTFESSFRRHGVALRYLPSACDMVWRALTTPLTIDGTDLGPVCRATRFQRELEFLYPLPTSGAGYVRGFIDLLAEIDGRYYVLDWKTDVIGDYSPAGVAAHVPTYQLQIELYSVALARLLGGNRDRFGGLLYLFVRGLGQAEDDTTHGLFAVRPNTADLDAAYGRLKAVGHGS